MSAPFKACCACGVERPVTAFRPHRQMANGHMNKCRVCENSKRNSRRNKLTADLLRSYLHYNPETGDFTRIADVSTAKAGDSPGSVTTRGYLVISVNGVTYRAHRLAWLYMTGEWPRDQIDHKDLNKLNNAWSNLREATPAQNTFNRRALKNSESGIKGVIYRRRQRKWMAQICLDGAIQCLGYFSSADEAAAAYAAAARKLHGEFARLA